LHVSRVKGDGGRVEKIEEILKKTLSPSFTISEAEKKLLILNW